MNDLDTLYLVGQARCLSIFDRPVGLSQKNLQLVQVFAVGLATFSHT
ncbi:MAG: hypothetical protein KME26_03410 [Oscillatoria princeps RMCB-10]|nr:hypothetical protein [Oscillatoria princeps RMCB-10]